MVAGGDLTGTSAAAAEGVILVTLLVGYALWFLVRMLGRSRPDFHIGWPLAVGFSLRLAAIAAIGVTGLQKVLRGGDEATFLSIAHDLAKNQPFGHGYIPHGRYQLHVVLFAFEDKIGLTTGSMRIVQVGIALTGVVLILAAVHDLAGGRAATLAAWVIAFEPASIFFNSALHKEPNMELASGLVVFGGTMLWKRLDVRGILLCALGGAIAVTTRSYAGWFLVSAAVLVLFHASLRNMSRPLRALPAVYAVMIAVFLLTPTLFAVSSTNNLKKLQASQNANSNAIGTGSGGPNTDNLALEQVDFSSRGKILSNLPKRIRDVLLKPFPWQLQNANQKFGALGTVVAYTVMLLLVFYAWQSRGKIFPRAGPVLYPMLFLLVAYALAAGNAGTGFRYRTHLVTLVIAALAILREQVVLSRAAKRVAAAATAEPDTEPPTDALPTPA